MHSWGPSGNGIEIIIYYGGFQREELTNAHVHGPFRLGRSYFARRGASTVMEVTFIPNGWKIRTQGHGVHRAVQTSM